MGAKERSLVYKGHDLRKVGEFDNEIHAIAFVEDLQLNHITALIEEDGGSYAIWVHEEGHIETAKNMFEEVKKDGCKIVQTKKEKSFHFHNQEGTTAQIAYRPLITRVLLFTCLLVYALVQIQSKHERAQYPGMNSLPPIAKALIIEFPKDQEMIREIIDRYGLEKLIMNDLPEEATPLIKQHNESVPWVGVVNILLQPKERQESLWHGLFLTQVQEGEIWRLFTPAILHLGLLHLLFNLLWLVVLGKMIEFNMGRIRFILLIVLSAVISNICQYLMTGPFFMGVSGVLSAFIGYIWVRKKIAPWEVYLVPKQNITFFMIFILGFLGVSFVSFFLAYYKIYEISLTIANTAHVSGLLSGMVIAKLGVLSRKISR